MNRSDGRRISYKYSNSRKEISAYDQIVMRKSWRVPPLIRSTARFFNTGSIFAVEVDTKDLLAMVAFQLSMHNLELEKPE